jgi:signal transduction histidine kinase/DNA-binding response OmpR family regulator
MNPHDDPPEILLAEDSPTQAQQLQFLLERRGYRVSLVSNGREALERIARHPPALLLTDVVMPEMDGYTLCSAVKQRAPEVAVPVVLLTSLNDPADVIKGLEAGADSFIFKPYSERYLLARVESLLASRHLHGGDSTQMGVEIFFSGRKFFITSNRLQILNLLLSTYEAAVQRNQELSKVQEELRYLNEGLESAVRRRTHELGAEIDERKRVEVILKEKLARLQLLRETTRAIGRGMDLSRIFGVVCNSIEQQLPVDFCAIAQYDESRREIVMDCAGAQSRPMLQRLDLDIGRALPLDDAALARCLGGELVHQPDLQAAGPSLAKRLGTTGLDSVVLAPLRVDERTFGVVIAGRNPGRAFSDADVEYLVQLSEHVALAASQARLHGELRRAYDDLHRTQQIVLQQERLRALGEMASGIAHDINNAISPVALYTESLLEKEPGLSPRARGHLETIQRAIDDVAETVARLRQFYRPRDAQAEGAPMDINQLVRQVVDLTRARWRDMAQQAGVVIEVETALKDDLPRVLAPEGEIREALTNLVFNAVDAMPVGGTLTLRTGMAFRTDGSERVQIEVADTGTGMDEEARRRCMEPFFTTKGDRGTGLGLAMVYGTMQRHGASIEIDSAPGRGTTVRLIFPKDSSKALIESDWGELGSSEVLPALNLLLIDGDPLLLQSLTDVLESEGHRVTPVDGGQRGIEAFDASIAGGQPFDAVITDLGMPVVDGRQVARSVKARSPGTPIVMLTGWGRRMAEDGELPAGVDHLLGKPPTLNQLRKVLAHCTKGNPIRKEPAR